MSEEPQNVILCEGYHDRAFWTGWLARLGFENLGPGAVDPGGKKVSNGQYAFTSPAGVFTRVVPCKSDSKVFDQAGFYLKNHGVQPLRHLVVNRDSDSDEREPDDGPHKDRLGKLVADRWPDAEPDESRTSWRRPSARGGAAVSLVLWQTADEDLDGVPRKQTLERLVCAALSEVYRERARAVQAWLDGRPDEPDPPHSGPKQFSWSFMAGWSAAYGCDYFFEALWENDKLAAALERRLGETGARSVVEAML